MLNSMSCMTNITNKTKPQYILNMNTRTKIPTLAALMAAAALTVLFSVPGTLRAGVPTARDIDGDGIPNIVDPDVDNDGIPNGLDRNVDGGWAKSGPLAGRFVGDHLRNANPLELDIDDDGLKDNALNEEDIDGDGLNDDADEETDIDGDQRADDALNERNIDGDGL